MKTEFSFPPNRRYPWQAGATAWMALSLFGSFAQGQGNGNGGEALRRFIDQQVGGIQKLMVPTPERLPQPMLNGRPDPTFETTEAKRYLGKLLFFDPGRANRIVTEFGGVPAFTQTASCGTCHMGEAAGKAGTLINLATGGEGRGYTDANGRFIARRRTRPELTRLRPAALFPGDTLVDELPTLTDVYENAVGTPARGRKMPPPGRLLRTGRLDAVDSVGRNAPGIIGFGFNNRLLLGGFAGEPDASPGGLNPFGHPAQENLTLLLLDAHRMLETQSAVLQQIPAYVKLFRDAFPAEAALADSSRDMNLLINDVTILRATASFMRTIVTRNTPWDHFLAGRNNALTARQRRGVRLFFTPATQGGAGCFSCHSGPMLNKQPNDPDVTGVGAFVEENFFNVGVGNHPIQALNAVAFRDPNFRDTGRQEVTFRETDAFKFRANTLRQLKDVRFMFHNGSMTSVRDVVEYFNNGMPQDAIAGASGTLSPRFTFPRGSGSARGLGLDRGQIDDLTDFLENALYDPAHVKFDPNSTTPPFEPTVIDLTYSRYRPDLAALGARDGLMPSGRARSNNDPLSRRDLGLEFLDVTRQVNVTLLRTNALPDSVTEDVYRITNNSDSPVDTHLLMIATGLSESIRLENGSGITSNRFPYRRVFLPGGVLLPGQSTEQSLRFRSTNARYTLTLLSGQGNP